MYDNLLTRVYNQPHLIRPDKLEAIRRVVTSRALGIHADAAMLAEFKAANQNRRQSQVSGNIAVLPVVGTLIKRAGMMEDFSGGASTDQIGKEFDRLMADGTVGAIVLDVDSPGGESFGVQELADKIFAARGRKPIVAVANAEAASAAYWIATAADELVVTPSGWVGSVGVYMVHTDLSAMNAELGANVTYISAGEFKTEGNPDAPLTDEALGYYQGQVDAIYQTFLEAVARNRGVSAATVREKYGRGRMIMAADAKAARMVDRIETLEETLARLVGNRKAKARARAQRERERFGMEYGPC